ncbi:hypothetical protein [Streptomyces olivaceus]|uniref:hypothetical protein n=1 Tax=Streptomyces olivaceus TaxID=47716 RepID=UPI000AC74344
MASATTHVLRHLGSAVESSPVVLGAVTPAARGRRFPGGGLITAFLVRAATPLSPRHSPSPA